MGCDIHMHTEQRNADGTWSPVDQTYSTRNYRLFSALADVRNSYGFAGCDTGDPITPITQPRGLPEDVSVEVRESADEWDVNGHSHSWLSVRDLVTYDWDQTVVARGLTNDRDDRRFKDGGRAKWVVEYFERWHKWPPSTEIYGMTTDESCLPIEYRMPLSAHLSTAWFAFVLRLQRLADADPDSVRIVFWFDN